MEVRSIGTPGLALQEGSRRYDFEALVEVREIGKKCLPCRVNQWGFVFACEGMVLHGITSTSFSSHEFPPNLRLQYATGDRSSI